MKTLPELLNLYEDFFTKLSAKINTDPNDPIVHSTEFENPTDTEIDAFAKKFNVCIPDDIRLFWKSLKNVYDAAVFDNVEWEAGWDFISLDIIMRDTPILRDLAKNYEPTDPIKKLHQTGIQLTYAEPILLFDANPETKTGSIHHLLWDGSPLPDAIAPDFRTFFEHWLAAGCFKVRNFEAYWDVVKDIIPIKLPLKENLWLNFYNKQYNK